MHWATMLTTRFHSTYDEYKSELESGQLSWTPPHKNDDFWRDNAAKLNDKDREQLKWVSQIVSSFAITNVLASPLVGSS